LDVPEDETFPNCPTRDQARADRSIAATTTTALAGGGNRIGAHNDLHGRSCRRHHIPKVAFFGFQLINTSLEPTTPSETRRINMLNDLLRKRLDTSGRLRIVPIPPDLQQRIAAGPEIANCNGCERDLAKTLGANWAAWGSVQKVSNLILNINLYLEDVATARMEFAKSVDIRGNTEES
jgi:Protein of unknown function (DUF2380)